MAKPAEDDVVMVARNRRAAHQYELTDKLECGIMLVGTEVKSLRAGHCNLEQAYAKIEDDELWLVGCEIPEYAMGTHLNHKPKRTRKLLLHKREMVKFAEKFSMKGYTLVPLSIYFKAGKAKVEIAVARGKQLHDKRQTLKTAQAKRDMARAIARRK